MFRIIKLTCRGKFWYEVRFLHKREKIHYAFNTFKEAEEYAIKNL